MDSFEWNKIVGAVLGTLIFVLVVSFATEAIYEPEKPAKPGYVVEGVLEEASASGVGRARRRSRCPIGARCCRRPMSPPARRFRRAASSATISPRAARTRSAPICGAWSAVPRATHAGFSYSSAMTADHAPWTFDELFKFLKSPQAMVPGTKMSFAGLRSAQDRINLIAYLRTQSDSPVPIPPPAPKAPAAQAPAGPAPSTKAPAGAPATPEAPKKS